MPTSRAPMPWTVSVSDRPPGVAHGPRPWRVSDLPTATRWPLHAWAQARRFEQAAITLAPEGEWIAQAALSIAAWCRALSPHARQAFVLVGPGNNGADAWLAAQHLARCGIRVQAWSPSSAPSRSWTPTAPSLGHVVGVQWVDRCPELSPDDFILDGLFGLASRAGLPDSVRPWIDKANASPAQRLSIDLPSGMDARTGLSTDGHCFRAHHTLVLMALRPELFGAGARDWTGQIWWDPLLDEHQWQHCMGVASASAALVTDAQAQEPPQWLAHGAHKGSRGSTLVVGGQAGMEGAAWLAAAAALAAGSGKVHHTGAPNAEHPELMSVQWQELVARDDWGDLTVVAGCGGGASMKAQVPLILQKARRLVLDADGLNALNGLGGLSVLAERSGRPCQTVITPHPLEAARLLGCTVEAVQSDRLGSAQRLSSLGQCTAVLKGSGTIVATPGQVPWVHACGGAALASAGTGDVLAGWIGGWWSRLRDSSAGCTVNSHLIASQSVLRHGHAATRHFADTLTASELIQAMAQTGAST